MQWNIPNILTLIRLLAAPGVAIMFLYFARPLADWYAMILFILASVTDFLDGYLARKWKQESRFGAMMDPIADKAMVIIALVIITGLSSAEKLVMDPYILLPATIILFREVFVSGLREYLGDKANLLQVTSLAKWKTTVQMIAISVLFAKGVFEHYKLNLSQGMDDTIYYGILNGTVEDVNHLVWYVNATDASWSAGVFLLWVAAILTFITGCDYLRKGMPFLREDK
ncbi:CDP-diacylglycerol--glycerol-3-phosphate 3-phosphatidyltransferase [Amylibacter sp. SFDW26]|uniref:CDP-diacylglycerol--glycerol-3-phosphate 3-phosphatidyltransferase n=1 Tax=Amylibacter sp. SFDW26 TaxID=2652722 RepID=UPI0012613E24|nr:CDP-diacylglycerol--glycerol-3-phosphate 3-phosphatidyltransferase [Amylibacter sp. SFDW26]KAB7613976.1 CDP-diacylglycerol--glycerol-3-phosphate 3-phosphatidyltransferase [Amylibacter sp. SFDW26]